MMIGVSCTLGRGHTESFTVAKIVLVAFGKGLICELLLCSNLSK
jgi:hypothetical protein